MISEEWPDDVMIAVETLHHLQQVTVPSIFTTRLEQQVRARARMLRQIDERQEHRRFLSQLTPFQRRLMLVASVLLALVMMGGIVVSAAAQSLPGDWLYGIKQWSDQIVLTKVSTP